MKRFVLFAAILLAMNAPLHAQQPPADLVILHAHVWTVDKSRPAAEAIAITGSRISAVGADSEIQKLIGPHTQQIDAHEKSVLPGFNDAHVHFSSGGAEISGVQLRDADTPQEFARRIAERAKKLPKGEWLTGGTWDHELWGGANPIPPKTNSYATFAPR
jgi:predicted amidohydrolase YtcJ